MKRLEIGVGPSESIEEGRSIPHRPDPGQHPHLQDQQAQTRHKQHPALEQMVEPFAGPLPVPFDQHSDHPDAKTIHENGDRNRRENDHHSLPHPILEEIGAEERKGDEWKQIPNAAAGFDDLQLDWPQIDHIAIAKGRHANKLQAAHTESRGPQL